MNVIWHQIQQMELPADDNFWFKLFFKVANYLLIAPHSNAGIEQLYSLLNKNKPEGSDRNRMDIDGSLSYILGIKLAQPESACTCYNVNLSQNLLESAKKLIMADNEEQGNKQSTLNA